MNFMGHTNIEASNYTNNADAIVLLLVEISKSIISCILEA